MDTTPNETRTTVAAALYPALLLMPTPPAWAAHSVEWREQCAAEAVLCTDALLAALSASQPAQPEESEHSAKWKVRISDGFCEYQYDFRGRGDASVSDVADCVLGFLRARGVESRHITQPAQSPPAKPYALENPLREVLNQMNEKGGPFVNTLADLARVSDPENKAKLLAAFPFMFARYDGFATIAAKHDQP